MQVFYIIPLAQAGLVITASQDIPSAIEGYRTAQAVCDAKGVALLNLRLLDAIMACPGGEKLQVVRSILAEDKLT